MRGSARAHVAIKTEQEPAPRSRSRGTHYGEGLLPFDGAAWPRMRANRIEAAIGVAGTERETTMSNDSNTKTRPTHRVFSVTKNGDSKANWLEIGAAWPHKDGKGFNIKFNACPFGDAEIVLRSVTAKAAGAP